MISLNTVTVAGNLTRDPESKQVAGNKTVCSFSIANNRRFRSGDQQQEETSFFDVEAWGKTAEVVAAYLKKGRGVVVEGRLQQQRWQSTQGARSKVVIVAENVHFLGGKDGPEGGEAAAAPPAQGELKPENINFD